MVHRHGYTFVTILILVAVAVLVGLLGLKNFSGTVVIIANAPEGQVVHYHLPEIAQTDSIEYDYLVLALGSVTNLPPVSGLAEFGFEMKSLADAVTLRDRAILELQGLYIKVGQLFSIMTNFLPAEFLRELEGLQDNVPPRQLIFHLSPGGGRSGLSSVTKVPLLL